MERDGKVVIDRLTKNMTWTDIQAKYGIARRTGQVILKRWREQEHIALEDIDPVDEIVDMLHKYDHLIQSYTEIRTAAEKKGGKNLAVMLGANSGIARTVERKAALMQACGLLPRNLGRVKEEFDTRYLSATIIAVFVKYGVPDEAMDEIQAALRQRIASPQPALPAGPNGKTATD